MFTTHIINIGDYKYGDTVRIVPFGDIHREGHCDEERWKAFINYEKKHKTPTTLYIGMGDYFDFASTSERKILKSGLHETTIASFDKAVEKLCNVFSRELSFMRGNLIGLISGNHEWHFEDKKCNSTQYMATLLGTRYLGLLTYIRLQLEPRKCTKVAIDIFAHHGVSSAGKLLGTSINRIDNMNRIFPCADVLLQGHDHKRGGIVNTYLQAEYMKNELGIKQRQQAVVSTGSFLKGYVPKYSTYVSNKLMRPADLGNCVVEVDLVRQCADGRDNIVKEIHVRS